LCIAGFIDEDVQCFDTSTGKLTDDYYAEIHASSVSPPIQPAGLAFGGDGRMYLTSVFGGQLVKESKPGGPIVLLASLTAAPSELNGNLVFRGPCAKFPCLVTGPVTPYLYISAFSAAPLTFSTPDPVFKVAAATGAVTGLISGAAAPALASDHIWGGEWMIFLSPGPGPILLLP